MRRRLAYPLLAVVCAVPRLAVLVRERDTILSAFTEKSDVFALTFVQHGTFGFIPGEPSAATQPLYGWFLIPVYWIFGRSWESVGLAQLALAIVTCWLVYEIGRRVLGPRWGLLGAALATINPYLIWHDMHVNREIVDQVCAAALVLLTLMVAERPSKKLAALLGIVTGLAILGNTRLVFVPVICAGYLAWRLPRARATAIVAALVLAGAAAAVTPWLVRNKVQLGCVTLTTDGRALWKANNLQTYGLLSSGEWIDNIASNSPRPPAPNRLTPEDAYGYYVKPGVPPSYAIAHYPNECVEMSFYEHLTRQYWREHPGNKAKLAALVDEAALAAERLRDERAARTRHKPRHRAPRRRAGVHVRGLRPRDRRALLGPARVRRARAAATRVPESLRRGVRRGDALPRRAGTSSSCCSRRRR